MNPLYELSAAPHLPYALRPESFVNAMMSSADIANGVRMIERDGEIYIEIDERS